MTLGVSLESMICNYCSRKDVGEIRRIRKEEGEINIVWKDVGELGRIWKDVGEKRIT